MNTRRHRHFVSLADLAPGNVEFLVDRSCHYAQVGRSVAQLLDGATIGIYFRKTSTRTRTAFSVGALRLGARIVTYGPNDLQENTGETFEDTGRVLGCMLDGLVARTAGNPNELAMLVHQDQMAIINAMTADEHPTQAIADLATISANFGRIDGIRILYLGEGNNTASALALALARLPGVELHLRTPIGYGLLNQKLQLAQRMAESSGALIEERHDLSDLPPDIDVVYTTRWETTGTTKADVNWRAIFEPFRVDSRLLGKYPECRFMHDLPAHRGEEVEAEVLDGVRSIAFDQAQYKLYSAMAILEWCLAHR
jgi:ornithine carbamoyltransferase